MSTVVDANEAAQEWEREWWGSCVNTFAEEAKQLSYAHRMGLVNVPRDGRWPVYDLAGATVLDIGGGPASMLLKTTNGERMVVVDPCAYPKWVGRRYREAGIKQHVGPAETFLWERTFDEAWCYNCLQHTVSPRTIIAMAKRQAKRLRIFEWIETETNVGHPHTLHADELNDWIGGTGTVEQIDENGAVGLCYYGVFDLR